MRNDNFIIFLSAFVIGLCVTSFLMNLGVTYSTINIINLILCIPLFLYLIGFKGIKRK